MVGGADDAEVAAQLERLAAEASAGRVPEPVAPDPALASAPVRVAIDYADAGELAAKAAKAVQALRGGNPAEWRILRAQGVFVGRGAPGKVAFLYTGQGSQYVNMLRDLRQREPIVAATFDEADRVMAPLLGKPLTAFIFADGTDETTAQRLEQQLMQTEITQPAVLATDLALTRMLDAYGVRPDMVMGHSLGEYGALVAADALSFDAALEAVSARGQGMASLSVADNGAMAAVFAPLAEIDRIVAETDGYVVVANINSNGQAVIGGATDAVDRAVAAFRAAGMNANRIPVSHAFHTAIVAPVSEPLKTALRRLDMRPPRRPIVSNVTGEFYPADADVDTMLDLLGRQVASPVRFIDGLRTLYAAGARVFVEVGPKKALHGFVEDVLGDDVLALFTNHPKTGDVASFNQALCGLYAAGLGYAAPDGAASPPAPANAPVERTPMTAQMTDEQYVELGRLVVDAVERSMHAGPAEAARPTATESVVVTGAALGLPGVERVFDDENIARILDGQQFIDTIPHRLRQEMVDRHITRLVKRTSGDPTFETIANEAEVIKLAGRGAPLDVVAEFGVDAARDAALDSTTRLAIGAGFDALRDAGIPLVMHYKTTTLGTQLPDRWGLPESMRDDTGVIFASAFPGLDNFARDLERYYIDRSNREQLTALEAVRVRMTGDEPAAAEVDRRIHELRHEIESHPYEFDRRFIFRCLSMGHSQFAEIIGARGPNTQVNAACASTTQAVSVAEDWIRTCRCRRVIVVSADDASSDALLPWLASGFLASGAAATDDIVEDAATPFDQRRHGMILGMGAAAFVVESAESAAERGLQPICEVLSTVTANSAFHGTRLDVEHIGAVMEKLLVQAEARGVNRHAIAPNTTFMSHETYTPARGGSAAAEIHALRKVFGPDADAVVITNTKGFTGHAMGAGVEDVVAIKSLETGLVPPVPNYKEPDPELGHLNLSTGGSYPVQYALRLGAGFGSQIAMTLMRWTPVPDGRHRQPDELGYKYRIVDQAAWRRWLAAAAGSADAALEVVQHRLRVVDTGPQAKVAPSSAPVQTPTVQPAPLASKTVLRVPAPAAAPPAPAAAPAPAPAAAPGGDELTDTVVGIVSELTGYPPDLLDVDLDLEADLGVDTVKQAEIFAAIRQHFGVARDDTRKVRDFPTLTHVVGWIRDKTGTPAAPATAPPAPAEAPAPVPAAAPGGDEVTETVVGIVSELTGYPPDLLDVDLDLEADLGVDTVKQAEIFAAIRQHYGVARDDTLKVRDFPTLTHVVGWIRDKTGTQAPPPAPAQAPAAPAAPTEAAEAPPVAAPPAAGDEVTETVVGIVSELTGYPPDLLDVDLDLEADLGVDTVKQAEIFAAIRQHYGVARDDTLKLRDFPTLTHVTGWIRDKTGTQAPPKKAPSDAAAATASTAAATQTVKGDIAATSQIPRRVPVAALRPGLKACVPTGVNLGAGTRVAVMPDQGGVADALVSRLTSLGVETLVLSPVDDIDTVLADGSVNGVYWLAALDDEGRLEDMDLTGWQEALRCRVRNLYLTMRRLYEQSPFLVVATRLGGYHGYDAAGATCPLGGAVTGFTKAYRRERPDALVKAVDFPVNRKTSALADVLIDETLRDPGCVEVGHAAGRRWGVGLADRPFPDVEQTGEFVGSDPVFLVTGAAGSIVSAITADLATTFRGTFHLLDLTPTPDPADPDLLRYANDRDGFIAELAARMRERGERPTPVLIERELARLERLQAALAAMRAVEEAGGTAHYHSVDLTDAAAVEKVIAAVRDTNGRIDVLVHAAGIEVSHSLPDKEPREFDLVLGVKGHGLFNVLHAVGAMPLGAVVAFSSVAGRFGNVGQTDYSAANDLQCKVLSSLRRTRPGLRTLVVDWTAWGTIGMATRGSIPTIMAAAGVEMLPAPAGVAWIRRELCTGMPDGEVVVAGALGALAAEFHDTGGLDPASVTADGPLVGEVVRASVHDGLVVRTTLDPNARPFLDHHRIDGMPVLPGVMGMEAFAEVGLLLAPELHVAAVENVDFRAPLKFYRDEPRTLTITALLHPDGDDLLAECRLSAERTLPGADEPQTTVHFTGSVRLTSDPPMLTGDQAATGDDTPALTPEQVYRLYFHGPAYQVVSSAWKHGEGAAARFAADLPPQVDAPTFIGPRLVELCFQTVGLLEAGTDGVLALPLHVGAVRLAGRPEERPGLVATARRDGHGGFTCTVHDDDGTLVVRLDGYRTVPLPDPPPADVITPMRAVIGG